MLLSSPSVKKGLVYVDSQSLMKRFEDFRLGNRFFCCLLLIFKCILNARNLVVPGSLSA
jgi:hypothetical protein